MIIYTYISFETTVLGLIARILVLALTFPFYVHAHVLVYTQIYVSGKSWSCVCVFVGQHLTQIWKPRVYKFVKIIPLRIYSLTWPETVW